jgi:uncharacterized membrane protein YdjX (TVP38/TMEM64 family)
LRRLTKEFLQHVSEIRFREVNRRVRTIAQEIKCPVPWPHSFDAGFDCWLCIDLLPLLKEVVDHIRNEQDMIEDIHQAGTRGFLIIVAFQALQIITVVFPTVAIQILAGLALGVWKGLLACIAGYLIGNAIIFILIQQLSKFMSDIDLTVMAARRLKNRDFSFIRQSRNATVLALFLFLFLIPGIPDGVLPYLFAQTEISLPRYLLCIMFAAAPTILLSSLTGSQIAGGHFLAAAATALFLLIVSLLVIIFRRKIMNFIRRQGG